MYSKNRTRSSRTYRKSQVDEKEAKRQHNLRKFACKTTAFQISVSLIAVASVLLGLYLPIWLEGSLLGELMLSYKGFIVLLLICVVFVLLGRVVQVWTKSKQKWCRLFWLPFLFMALSIYMLEVDWHVLIPCVLVFLALMFIAHPYIRVGNIPVDNFENDLLGRRLLYQNFDKRIREKMTMASDRGLAIAVRGEWGSGKSHFIDYLTKKLKEKYDGKSTIDEKAYKGKYAIAYIDVWRCDTKESISREIALAISSAVVETNYYFRGEWSSFLSKVLGIFRPSSAAAFDEALQILTVGGEGVNSCSEVFRQRMLKTKKPCALIIDNIERSNPTVIKNLMPLLERLKSLPLLTTICGISYENMLMTERGASDYVENIPFLKVFDIVIPIPKAEEKYLSYYIRHCIEKKGGEKFPRLLDWITMQDFIGLSSPREVERVTDSLCLIEELYLSRTKFAGKHQEAGDDVDIQELYNDAIFTVSSLAVLHPDIAVQLERSDNLVRDLQWYKKEDNPGAGGGGEAVHANAPFGDNPRVVSILRHLSEFGSEHLHFAIKRKYMHLSALRDEECDGIISNTSDDIPPLKAIKTCLGDECSNIEMPAIYDSVLLYAIANSWKKNCYDYLRLSLNKEILVNTRGFRYIYRIKPELFLRILDCWAQNICGCRNWNDGKYYELLVLLASRMSRSALCDLIEQINTLCQRDDSDCGEQETSLSEFAPYLNSRYNMLLREIDSDILGELQGLRKSLEALLVMLSSKYLLMLFKSIVRSSRGISMKSLYVLPQRFLIDERLIESFVQEIEIELPRDIPNLIRSLSGTVKRALMIGNIDCFMEKFVFISYVWLIAMRHFLINLTTGIVDSGEPSYLELLQSEMRYFQELHFPAHILCDEQKATYMKKSYQVCYFLNECVKLSRNN